MVEGGALDLEAGTEIIERMTTSNSCVHSPHASVPLRVMSHAHLDALFLGVLPLLPNEFFSPKIFNHRYLLLLPLSGKAQGWFPSALHQ